MLRYLRMAGAVLALNFVGTLAHADGKDSLRAEAASVNTAPMACASPLAGGLVDDYADRYRNRPVFRFLAPSGPAGQIRIFRGGQVDTEDCYTGGVHAPPRPAFEVNRGVRIFRGGVADRPYHIYLR